MLNRPQNEMDLYYTYGRFEEAIDALVNDIVSSGFSPDVILAPLRGGAIPATFLSYRLSDKLEKDIRVYAFEAGREYALSREDAERIAEMGYFGKNLLWVDDIVDSGDTLREFMNYPPNGIMWKDSLMTATLIWNEDCGIHPDFYAEKINRSTFPDYIVFFWEE